MSSACVWWGNAALYWVTVDTYMSTCTIKSTVTHLRQGEYAYTKHYNNKWAAPGGVLH